MFKCIFERIFEHMVSVYFWNLSVEVIKHKKKIIPNTAQKIYQGNRTMVLYLLSSFLLFPLRIINWFGDIALKKDTLALYWGRTLAFHCWFQKQNAVQTGWEQHPFDTNTREITVQVYCLLRKPGLALLQVSFVETLLFCCLTHIMEHTQLSRTFLQVSIGVYLQYTLLGMYSTK